MSDNLNVRAYSVGTSGGVMSKPRKRLRVYTISATTALHLFKLMCNQEEPRQGFFAVPILPSIPSDADVIAIREDFERRAFSILVEHESFDEVPDGQMPPVEGLDMQQIVHRTVPVEPIEDETRQRLLNGEWSEDDPQPDDFRSSPLYCELTNLMSIRDGWDGEGSFGINHLAIKDAIKLCEVAWNIHRRISVDITPLRSGSINLMFRGNITDRGNKRCLVELDGKYANILAQYLSGKPAKMVDHRFDPVQIHLDDPSLSNQGGVGLFAEMIEQITKSDWKIEEDSYLDAVPTENIDNVDEHSSLNGTRLVYDGTVLIPTSIRESKTMDKSSTIYSVRFSATKLDQPEQLQPTDVMVVTREIAESMKRMFDVAVSDNDDPRPDAIVE